MIKFRDYYNNEVHLSFKDHPFSEQPKHVLIICRYQGKWLLTRHKERGLEFPGGKVEEGETAEEAGIREVMEETGGKASHLQYIGQYYVDGRKDYVIKNIYYAEIEELNDRDTYFETEGPVIIDNIPNNVNHNPKYSFIMKDKVIDYAIDYIIKEHNKS
ncbi:nucleoside triphosphatase YtkD [Oceanobacillus luteolus]|uniref:RNA deprotection pyrophosphohydrolase n=1 Tax=Oceanobacillus luteolus TaxID=1274358 RepID=A0ABW4HSL9_9BACI|nr:nucleoside triphosphatase YtkD [Oceanobacillus luteolus]MCM3740181.1 nucleoside triphosphatase YtkD [Oceanobacillus luteolus]